MPAVFISNYPKLKLQLLPFLKKLLGKRIGNGE